MSGPLLPPDQNRFSFFFLFFLSVDSTGCRKPFSDAVFLATFSPGGFTRVMQMNWWVHRLFKTHLIGSWMWRFSLRRCFIVLLSVDFTNGWNESECRSMFRVVPCQLSLSFLSLTYGPCSHMTPTFLIFPFLTFIEVSNCERVSLWLIEVCWF